jgi:hypothetical protein
MEASIGSSQEQCKGCPIVFGAYFEGSGDAAAQLQCYTFMLMHSSSDVHAQHV